MYSLTEILKRQATNIEFKICYEGENPAQCPTAFITMEDFKYQEEDCVLVQIRVENQESSNALSNYNFRQANEQKDLVKTHFLKPLQTAYKTVSDLVKKEARLSGVQSLISGLLVEFRLMVDVTELRQDKFNDVDKEWSVGRNFRKIHETAKALVGTRQRVDVDCDTRQIPDDLKLCGDCERIEMITLILVQFCLTRTQRGTIVISMDYQSQAKRLYVSVSDNGRGVNEEEIRMQLQQDMSQDLFKNPQQKMAIVCRLLSRLGGEIVDLRSSTEMGTSFQFYVPAMTAA